jgi:hypothetical protein
VPNGELVDEHATALHGLLTMHWEETASPVARRLLDTWETARDEFTAVVPRDYQRAVRVIRAVREAGREVDESVMAELAAGEPRRIDTADTADTVATVDTKAANGKVPGEPNGHGLLGDAAGALAPAAR